MLLGEPISGIMSALMLNVLAKMVLTGIVAPIAINVLIHPRPAWGRIRPAALINRGRRIACFPACYVVSRRDDGDSAGCRRLLAGRGLHA